jgi:adenosylcobinamide-GDP ribazoletransferase
MNVRPPRFAVDIAVAFQFLTRLPIKHATYAEDGLARSVKFFPLVGLVIGSGGAAGKSAGPSS